MSNFLLNSQEAATHRSFIVGSQLQISLPGKFGLDYGLDYGKANRAKKDGSEV